MAETGVVVTGRGGGCHGDYSGGNDDNRGGGTDKGFVGEKQAWWGQVTWVMMVMMMMMTMMALEAVTGVVAKAGVLAGVVPSVCALSTLSERHTPARIMSC